MSQAQEQVGARVKIAHGDSGRNERWLQCWACCRRAAGGLQAPGMSSRTANILASLRPLGAARGDNTNAQCAQRLRQIVLGGLHGLAQPAPRPDPRASITLGDWMRVAQLVYGVSPGHPVCCRAAAALLHSATSIDESNGEHNPVWPVCAVTSCLFPPSSSSSEQHLAPCIISIGSTPVQTARRLVLQSPFRLHTSGRGRRPAIVCSCSSPFGDEAEIPSFIHQPVQR
ncbi:hypothetical protein BJ546DRAFT_1103747 [Cryomyces antarcticus]